MQRKRLRESLGNHLHTASWFFVAVPFAIGCSGTTTHWSSTTNPASTPATVVNLGVARTPVETPVAADEIPPEDTRTPPTHTSGPLVGHRAPHIAGDYVIGNGPTSIEEARGKVLLIDFWATFCAPCRDSFPKYQALQDQFGSDFVVLAVNVDDEDTDVATLKEFVQNTGVKFSVLWDKQRETAQLYQPPKMPTSFIVDRSGIVRHVHAGYTDRTAETMAQQIKALIAR